jgi:subtilisin family serine protease
MATPHVAGVAALYLEKNPTAKPAEVATALRAGALKDVIIDAQSKNGNYLLNTAFLGGPVVAPVVSVPVVTPAPKAVASAVPAKVTGVFASKAGTGYKLSWNAPVNAPISGIIGYKVESSTTGSVWTTVATTSTASADVPTTGYYRVSAIGSIGTGQPSLTVRVK